MEETMVSSTKQICRLCIEKPPAAELENIDEIKKEMLEVLLININFNITKYAVACKRCLTRLRDSFDFKAHCIETAVEGGKKADVEKVFPREMMSSKEIVCVEDLLVCRLCMSVIQDEDVNEVVDLITGVLLKDVVRNCLPEMDLNDIQESLLCKLCLKSLKEYYEFMEDCRVVERLCEAAHRGTAKMAIEEMLKSKVKTECCDELVKPGIIKEESSPDAEDYVNPVRCPKNEDIASIECEELHIKDEGDIGEEIGDSVPLGASNNSVKSGSLKRKRQTRKSASKGRKYFSCDDHIARHGGLTKIFDCQECPFKTNRKHILVRHMVRHKDEADIEVLSQYNTRNKKGTLNDQLSQNCTKRKCEKYPRKTNNKSNLWTHSPTDKHADMEMYKCENCEFGTKFKNSMVRHMRRKHRNPEAERKFKCDKCSYGTEFYSELRRHSMIHMDKSEVMIHKCEICEHETRHKRNMNKHMAKHRDPNAERKFKCDKCSYETDVKYNLQTHNLIHRDKSAVNMHKCDNCEFATMHKRYLKQHMVRHRDPIAEKKFKCD